MQYGSYTVTQRGKRNTPCTLVCPLEDMNDTEVYIYSADRLAAIGDLSALQVGYANFSMAGKLQSLKLGDGAENYQNTRLTELYVGNNGLLSELDIQNCINLNVAVDLSGCVGLEHIKAKGSAITGVNLPVGGRLRALELPASVTNLTLRELRQFETLDMAGFRNLTTLRTENTPNVPLDDIITGAENLNRVRLLGVEWEAESETSLQASITKLKGCVGMDAAGQNTPAAVVTGRVSVSSISPELLTEINDSFPQLVVVAGGEPQYIVRYVDWDNTLLSSSTSTSYTGKIRLTSTGQITVVAEIEDAPKRVFSHYREGTGTIGGWEKSELRVYYNDTLLPLIPENVRAQLKTVLKNHPAYDTAGNSYTQTTEEKVCPPSYTELYANASSTNQPRYKALFPDNASRVKKKAGATSAVSWRLRSANNNNYFDNVQSSGSYSGNRASTALGLPLCFFT